MFGPCFCLLSVNSTGVVLCVNGLTVRLKFMGKTNRLKEMLIFTVFDHSVYL